MNVKKISFKELEEYNNIEMKKTFDRYRDYTSSTKYTEKIVRETTFDWTNTEKMSLWREILNEETTGVFVIEEDNKWVAGCVVVTHSPKVHMLEGDMTNAVLWDIRVATKYQKRGFGSLLFQKVVLFAKKMNTKQLLIETQNNNPKAITFYEKQQAKIYKINKGYYKDLPKEDQIILKLKF